MSQLDPEERAAARTRVRAVAEARRVAAAGGDAPQSASGGASFWSSRVAASLPPPRPAAAGGGVEEGAVSFTVADGPAVLPVPRAAPQPPPTVVVPSPGPDGPPNGRGPRGGGGTSSGGAAPPLSTPSTTASPPAFAATPAAVAFGRLEAGSVYRVGVSVRNVSGTGARFQVPRAAQSHAAGGAGNSLAVIADPASVSARARIVVLRVTSAPAPPPSPAPQRGSIAAGMARTVEVEIIARAPGRFDGAFEIVTASGPCTVGVTAEVVPAAPGGGPRGLAPGVRVVGEAPRVREAASLMCRGAGARVVPRARV